MYKDLKRTWFAIVLLLNILFGDVFAAAAVAVGCVAAGRVTQ